MPTVLTSSVQLNNEVVSPVVSIDEAVLYFKTFDFTKVRSFNVKKEDLRI